MLLLVPERDAESRNDRTDDSDRLAGGGPLLVVDVVLELDVDGSAGADVLNVGWATVVAVEPGGSVIAGGGAVVTGDGAVVALVGGAVVAGVPGAGAVVVLAPGAVGSGWEGVVVSWATVGAASVRARDALAIRPAPSRPQPTFRRRTIAGKGTRPS